VVSAQAGQPFWPVTKLLRHGGKGKLPFAFNFNGNAQDSFSISSSGVLTFSAAAASTAAPAYASVSLPSSTIPDNSVCILGLQTAGNNSNYANIVSKTFGTAPNRQYWLTFSAYNAITAGATGFCFWSIVLEETSNKIYIVDQRYAGTAAKLSIGVQVNSTTATSVAGSPNLASIATTDATAIDNGYYTFIPGTQPASDLEGKSITVEEYLILNTAPFQIKGVLRNTGSQTCYWFHLKLHHQQRNYCYTKRNRSEHCKVCYLCLYAQQQLGLLLQLVFIALKHGPLT
jgi:hypothetical protein